MADSYTGAYFGAWRLTSAAVSQYRSSIVSAAKVLAESTATDIMNAAMGEALAQYSGTAEDLLVYRDTQGNIVACGVDTVAINTISTVTLNAI
ncbi:MAG: hypothetical protein ACLTXL_06980 [Clostridia bacterium]